MTFSANPARKSPFARLRRAAGPGRALGNVLIAALVLALAGALLSFQLVRGVVAEQAAQLGGALAADAAGRAAEYLVHNDLVSLNVVTASLSRQPGIVGVTVYDRYRQPLAQSGLVQPTPDTQRVSADVLTENGELRGTVELLMDPRSVLPALSRFDYALAGWVLFTALMLVVVARLQRELVGEADDPASTDDDAGRVEAMAAHDVAEETAVAGPESGEAPLSHLPQGPVLRIDIVNLERLEQLLAPRILDDLVSFYSEILAQACVLYHGNVVRPVSHQCLVSFPPSGGDEEETLFRAVCCAQLFFGVVRETNEERRRVGKMTMQFTAALHHDPSLGSEDRALVTWEICRHAGTAGRLTVTDTLSEHPALGERIVVDASRRHVLQIELPAGGTDDEAEPRLQDVLALGVLRLADPWEGLLAQQVRRLCEPAAA